MSVEIQCREKVISSKGKVVIKVGTRLLTQLERIPQLIYHIDNIRKKGYQVILVSSGAVGLGMRAMGLAKRPKELSKKQALASIGQGKLMSLYEAEASKYGFSVGQILLTMTGLRDREQHLNALNCINSLLDMNVLPIINENDSVAVEELTFGDNDTLAVLVAMMLRCRFAIILTSVDGLYEVVDGKFGNRISVIEKITPEIKKMAMGTDDSQSSVGGMASKLKAASMLTDAGDCLWIADGRDMSVLDKIFSAEDVGTLFVAGKNKVMPSKKRWLSFFAGTHGQIQIDAGAETAILEKGRSLLPSGIRALSGNFKKGSAVDIINKDRKPIAKGLTNYSIDDLRKIIGLRSSEVDEALGFQGYEEAIHRDNLVLYERS